MCTFGFTARLLENDLNQRGLEIRALRGRFTKAVTPGDTLTVRAWVDETGSGVFQVSAGSTVVIDRGSMSTEPAAGAPRAKGAVHAAPR
jgi:acyl dehydratase